MKNKIMVAIGCVILILCFSYIGSLVSNFNFWKMVLILTLEVCFLVSIYNDLNRIIWGDKEDYHKNEILKVKKNTNKSKRKWKPYRNVKK